NVRAGRIENRARGRWEPQSNCIRAARNVLDREASISEGGGVEIFAQTQGYSRQRASAVNQRDVPTHIEDAGDRYGQRKRSHDVARVCYLNGELRCARVGRNLRSREDASAGKIQPRRQRRTIGQSPCKWPNAGPLGGLQGEVEIAADAGRQIRWQRRSDG